MERKFYLSCAFVALRPVLRPVLRLCPAPCPAPLSCDLDAVAVRHWRVDNMYRSANAVPFVDDANRIGCQPIARLDTDTLYPQSF